jgi:hypothetical protein
MASGAAFNFDSDTDAAIRGLWQLQEDAGVPSRMLSLNYPPHMTIITCEDTDVARLAEPLREFLLRVPPMTVNFHSLGVFNTVDGVIYLSPVVTSAMLDLHASLWRLMEPYVHETNLLYSPGMWVPHVTLNVEVPEEKIGLAMDVLHRANLPRVATIQTLFIADFDGEKPDFKELFKLRFGGG